MVTTFRSDIVAAVVAVLTAQQTATPTQLRAIYSSRPGSFPETPCAYVGARDEVIRYSGQLRTRTFVGLTVTLVDTFADPTQAGDRLDDLVDLLVDRFTAAYAQVAGGGSILGLSRITDTEIEVASASGASTVYRGVVLGFDETFVTEGRT